LQPQISLGSLKGLQDAKNTVRVSQGLSPLPEDTYEVCKNMRASSPPASAVDLIEQQLPRRAFRGGKRVWIFYLIRNVIIVSLIMYKVIKF
jgi:hypothetical protein